jgi:hypothetical protein
VSNQDVPDAFVPVLKFRWDNEFDFDLLYAPIPTSVWIQLMQTTTAAIDNLGNQPTSTSSSAAASSHDVDSDMQSLQDTMSVANSSSALAVNIDSASIPPPATSPTPLPDLSSPPSTTSPPSSSSSSSPALPSLPSPDAAAATATSSGDGDGGQDWRVLSLLLRSDALLAQLDVGGLRALNGSLVTEMLLLGVPNPHTFTLLLRTVKLWAQRMPTFSLTLTLSLSLVASFNVSRFVLQTSFGLIRHW